MITYRTDQDFREEQLRELFLSVNWVSANYADQLVIAMKNSAYVVSAWHEDKLIGLVNVLSDGTLTAYIHYLLVKPEYQKQGIGTEMIKMVIDKYAGYLYLLLLAESKEVISFYRKLNFEVEATAAPMFLQKKQ
jgi:ribosomal protein S18 acetylase RimI-like enzyme